MKLPTLQEIEALHKKYASTPELFDIVFTHSNIVSDIASQLLTARNLNADSDLTRVGALLHDIGVYQALDGHGYERKGVHYITHGILGEAILKKEGFPEMVWRFASCHTGVGLTKQTVVDQNLPLPAADYVAETIEEELVMYADKFHTKTHPPCLVSFEWYKQYVSKFGSDKVGKFESMARQFGIPDLAPLADKYGHQMKDVS